MQKNIVDNFLKMENEYISEIKDLKNKVYFLEDSLDRVNGKVFNDSLLNKRQAFFNPDICYHNNLSIGKLSSLS